MNLKDLDQLAAESAKTALMMAREAARMNTFGADVAADKCALTARECIYRAETALQIARNFRAAGFVDAGSQLVRAA